MNTLFAVLYNSGARVSEAIRLTNADVLLDRGSALQLHGKGRRPRVMPLWKSTAASLRACRAHIDPTPDAAVFPNRTGQPLSRSGVEHRLQVALTTAMHLLQSGVDITVIALWLGHEDTATTHLYIEADLAMKTAALDHLEAPSSPHTRSDRRPLTYSAESSADEDGGVAGDRRAAAQQAVSLRRERCTSRGPSQIWTVPSP